MSLINIETMVEASQPPSRVEGFSGKQRLLPVIPRSLERKKKDDKALQKTNDDIASLSNLTRPDTPMEDHTDGSEDWAAMVGDEEDNTLTHVVPDLELKGKACAFRGFILETNFLGRELSAVSGG